jgi:hypothetical protein
VWDSYFKFCVERNPWDRLISLYYWRYKSDPRPTISEFISSNAPLALKEKGYELYTINGMLAVDKVCQFENLSRDLEEVMKQVGISEKLELPTAKSKSRKDKRNYRDIIGETNKAIIADMFVDEIGLLGYDW